MESTTFIPVTVAKRVADTEDIVAFELAALEGGELPGFSAGAHIDVEIAPGLVRQYSLCNSPLERHRYVIGVLKSPDSRGGSTAMHALDVGALMRISSPRNHFALDMSATRSVLLAGGIGLTPLLCMAEHLDHIGADFDLHYCTRSPNRAAFRERLTTSSFAARVHCHYDDGDPEQKLDIDAALGVSTPGIHVYVCGPTGFIEFVLNAAAAKGFSNAQVHREYFNASTSPLEGGAFQVKLSSSARVLDIPAERSVLDVLRTAGIDIASSCEQGVCGICLTGVIEGIPDHRDLVLTHEERLKGDQFTPCCSRSKTPMLVLAL